MKKLSKIIALGICLMLVMGLLAACGQTKQQTGANEQSTTGQPSQEKKVWVVGTSPDYPPFEFVDEKGNYVGFDMDLAREIGNRLGMEVKIEALEFDSLIASLKQGKIDAVIACMSPTPERLEEADFTDFYYETKQAILVKPDSNVEIKTVDDLLKYNFAVQTGTTMDDWAKNKVKEGAAKDSQVKRYTDVNVAALDLKNGRVDAFLLDLPVAYGKVKELGLKVAVEFPLETSEDPAIVLPKGSDEMKQKLNGIIKELKEDGIIKQLEDKWIKQQ